MKPDRRFINQPNAFWSNVRLISQRVGYKIRGKAQISIPSFQMMKNALIKSGLGFSHIVDENDKPTAFGKILKKYFVFRADTLNNFVEPRLMDVDRAKETFEKLYIKFSPTCPIPLNKQKGQKENSFFYSYHKYVN